MTLTGHDRRGRLRDARGYTLREESMLGQRCFVAQSVDSLFRRSVAKTVSACRISGCHRFCRLYKIFASPVLLQYRPPVEKSSSVLLSDKRTTSRTSRSSLTVVSVAEAVEPCLPYRSRHIAHSSKCVRDHCLPIGMTVRTLQK